MSIQRTAAVWEKSTHKGAALLLLLALADIASDNGYCWPGIDTLAKRTRSHRMTVIRNLACLEASGEVIIAHNVRGNRYLVTVGMEPEAIRAALMEYFDYTVDECQETLARLANLPVKSQNVTTRERSNRMLLQKSQNVTSVVTLCALDPSITVKEPSSAVDSSAIASLSTARAPAPDAPATTLPGPSTNERKPQTSPQDNGMSDVPVQPRKRSETPPHPQWKALCEEIVTAQDWPPAAQSSWVLASKLAHLLLGDAVTERGITYQLPPDTIWHLGDYTRFTQWWHDTKPKLTLPTRLEAQERYWLVWRTEARQEQARRDDENRETIEMAQRRIERQLLAEQQRGFQ